MVQSQGPRSLTIAGLAAAGGVGVETVRFYQRRGLLDQPTRESGIRRYGSEDVRRLRFIRQAQTAGFTLEEIKELLALDEKIAELGRARESLQRLARECGQGRSGPCPILTSFGI